MGRFGVRVGKTDVCAEFYYTNVSIRRKDERLGVDYVVVCGVVVHASAAYITAGLLYRIVPNIVCGSFHEEYIPRLRSPTSHYNVHL